MIITTSHFNRPDYTRKMLSHLSRVRGIENTDVIAYIDRDENGKIDEEVVDLLVNSDFCDMNINISEDHLGCNLNIMRCLYIGFENSTSVLHLEDDFCLSPDALDYAWHIEEAGIGNSGNPAIKSAFSVSFFNRAEEKEVNGDFGVVGKREHFSPWGFMLQKHIFKRALFNGCFLPDSPTQLSWDICMNNLRARLGLYEIFPKFSRGLNIGAIGLHTPSVEWFNENIKLDYWAGNVEFNSKSWELHI